MHGNGVHVGKYTSDGCMLCRESMLSACWEVYVRWVHVVQRESMLSACWEVYVRWVHVVQRECMLSACWEGTCQVSACCAERVHVECMLGWYMSDGCMLSACWEGTCQMGACCAERVHVGRVHVR